MREARQAPMACKGQGTKVRWIVQIAKVAMEVKLIDWASLHCSLLEESDERELGRHEYQLCRVTREMDVLRI